MPRKPYFFIQRPKPPAPSRARSPRPDRPYTDTRPESGSAEYFRIKEHLAADLRHRRISPDLEALMEHIVDCADVNVATAAEHVERFVSDLDRDLQRRKR